VIRRDNNPGLARNEPALEFDRLLETSVKTHGHLCPGQVLGVRMSLLGLRLIGIDDPRGKDRKDLIVFVEIDRCATDAVQSVTGCSLGKRSLKFMDYGKMAATFLRLSSGHAVRIVAREESREIAKRLFPHVEGKYNAQTEAYKVMPDEDLFTTEEVIIELAPEEMPGKPLQRVTCTVCGEAVQDMREVIRNGTAHCRPCATNGYYRAIHQPLD